MQLSRISIQNFMGVRSLELKPSAPVTLITGLNGAGKSSTIEAIRAAMVGRIDRVKLKREYNALVTEGERIGFAVVDHEHGRCGMTLPNGTHEVEGLQLHENPALEYVLDVHQFGAADESKRRAFLHDLLGIKTTPEAIAGRLVGEYRCRADLVEQIRPLLASGFDAAHKRAKESVSEARGAWKATTGETYGAEKAKTWAPPEIDAPTQEQIDAAVSVRDAALAESNEAIRAAGTVDAEAKAYAAARARIEMLQQQADQIDRHRARLERSEAELTVWSDKLATLPPEPGAVSLRPPMACPDCGSALTLRDGALHHHSATKPDDHDTAVKRDQWTKAVDLHKSTIEHAKRDILTAERAKVELADIDGMTPVAEGAQTKAAERVAAANVALAQARSELDELHARSNAAAARQAKIQQASSYHQDVVEWSKLADALAPEGLRTRIVADAIGPANRTISVVADVFQWPTPQIGADMQIRVGSNARLYPLLSESEQWRVDVLIGTAISALSGIRFLLVDRFDMLDMQGRADLIGALADLCDDGTLKQAIIAGTLKAPPAGLPENCAPIWMGMAQP